MEMKAAVVPRNAVGTCAPFCALMQFSNSPPPTDEVCRGLMPAQPLTLGRTRQTWFFSDQHHETFPETTERRTLRMREGCASLTPLHLADNTPFTHIRQP